MHLRWLSRLQNLFLVTYSGLQTRMAAFLGNSGEMGYCSPQFVFKRNTSVPTNAKDMPSSLSIAFVKILHRVYSFAAWFEYLMVYLRHTPLKHSFVSTSHTIRVQSHALLPWFDFVLKGCYNLFAIAELDAALWQCNSSCLKFLELLLSPYSC